MEKLRIYVIKHVYKEIYEMKTVTRGHGILDMLFFLSKV